MRESYPSGEGRSSPAPALPEAENDRFQFSLRQLLAFMFASAVFAAGLRYVFQWLERLPQHVVTGLPGTILLGVLFGALLYFLVRGPFLLIGGVRTMSRWRSMQRHRRELAAWAEQVRRQRKDSGTGEVGDHPPGED